MDKLIPIYPSKLCLHGYNYLSISYLVTSMGYLCKLLTSFFCFFKTSVINTYLFLQCIRQSLMNCCQALSLCSTSVALGQSNIQTVNTSIASLATFKSSKSGDISYNKEHTLSNYATTVEIIENIIKTVNVT